MFGLFKWLRKRQRATDIEVLWPVCKAHAKSLDDAKAAFAVHVFMDPAWSTDFTDDELKQIIEGLQ
jgi:hypothetical protein